MNKLVWLLVGCVAAAGSLSAQVVVSDLHDEIDSGRVRLVSATGNGSSSGASVEGYLINDTAVERHVGIYLSRPIYLTNSGAGQNMIATEVYLGDRGYISDGERSFIALSPGVRTRVLLIAYCVDFEKDNPTTKDRMAVGSVPPNLNAVMSNIGGYVRANPDTEVTVAAQLAIWLVQGVETTAIRSKFEFTPADERLARTFYPVAGQRPRSASEGEAAECFSDIPRCKVLANTGDAEAQSDFGLLYLEGQGIAQDDTEAARWFRLAAEQGHPLAQSNLGVMYAGGYGVIKDYAEAVRWYRLGAEQGHARAQSNLGVMYARGQGVIRDYEVAVRWYRLAAEQGDALGQSNLGKMYSKGQGVPKDDAEAVRLWRMAAAQGLAEAQTNLGAYYHGGQGIAKDDAEAVRWLQLAAAQGDALGQSNLGKMYFNGQGVPKDDAEAVRLWRIAAAQGLAEAEYHLGVMCAGGHGVPRDDVEAVRWYRLATAKRHAGAQSNLGSHYGTGRGVPKDDAEAVRWFRLAAQQGNADGQTNLGVMYALGRGITKNMDRAYLWFTLAAAPSAGDGDDNNRAARVTNRDAASRSLTRERREAMQTLAAKCRASEFTDCGEPIGP